MNWQKFTFEKTTVLKEIKIEVVNINGGTNASLKFKIFGIKCIMPEVIAREQDEKANKFLGLRKFIPQPELFRC